MRVTSLPTALSVTEQAAVSHLKLAKEAHFVSVKNNIKLRDAYLLSQDEAKAADNGSTLDLERKKRRTTERQRNAGRKLSQLKQVGRAPVTRLQTTVAGVTHMWETKDEVELAYIAEGQSRFSQTIHIPVMEEWIVTLVGFAAEKETAQHILDGVFTFPSHCDPYLRKFLEAVRQPEALRRAGPISTTITLEDHITGWRRMKERTASVRSEMEFPTTWPQPTTKGWLRWTGCLGRFRTQSASLRHPINK
jgi:hypothetical protein